MKHDQLMHQHSHNMHKGRVRMASQCMNSIAASPTVTKATRDLAYKIQDELDQLDNYLSSRVNLDGSIREGLYAKPR